MFSKLRSLIFKIDPEIAHNLAIKSLKFNFVTNIFDENKNDPMFQTTLFGKKIDNPIGMAAGFDKNAEVYNSLFKLGFGFVEIGTVTPLKQFGNPKPRIFRLLEDKALINRLGFNNFGAENINSFLFEILGKNPSDTFATHNSSIYISNMRRILILAFVAITFGASAQENSGYYPIYSIHDPHFGITFGPQVTSFHNDPYDSEFQFGFFSAEEIKESKDVRHYYVRGFHIYCYWDWICCNKHYFCGRFISAALSL